MVEKLVERHITDGVLKKYPPHRNQVAYQTGKSTETALHNMATRIESAIQYKGLAIGAFFVIDGTSLWHFSRNCQESFQGLGKQTVSKILGVPYRTQTDKRIPTRTLCQKN
jgi:hypothetical protein